MDPVNFSGLPVWIQGFAALAIALGGLFAGVMGYRKKSFDIPTNTTAQVVGGAFADRFAITELTEALRGSADKISAGMLRLADGQERFHKSFEHSIELLVEENSRLREEAAEIRRRLPLRG